LLDDARTRIEIMSYRLDQTNIVAALSRALQVEVPVCILADMRQIDNRDPGSPQHEALGQLLDRGAEVRALSLRDPRNNFPCVHAKAVILDKCVLWCGSFNFTRQATYNVELGHVTDCAAAVHTVRTVFRRAWASAVEMRFSVEVGDPFRRLRPARAPQDMRPASFYGGAQP